jgi:hypothetical protein
VALIQRFGAELSLGFLKAFATVNAVGVAGLWLLARRRMADKASSLP